MQRKGEISLGRVKRDWPYHVAITADMVMGSGADTLSVGPRAYHIRRDDIDCRSGNAR